MPSIHRISEVLSNSKFGVLNLVISGIPSIQIVKWATYATSAIVF